MAKHSNTKKSIFSLKCYFTVSPNFNKSLLDLITHAGGSRGRVFSGVSLSVCLSVCLFLPMISQKPLQLGSPNDKEMFHHEPRKLVYFGVKRSKVKVTRHKKTVPEWVFALLWVPAFSRFFNVVDTHLITQADVWLSKLMNGVQLWAVGVIAQLRGNEVESFALRQLCGAPSCWKTKYRPRVFDSC